MANSRSLTAKLSALLVQALTPARVSGQPVTVALSGGLDSVALLHAIWCLRDVHHWTIQAAHVHHGLQPAAGDFAAFCAQLCVRWQIPYHLHSLDLSDLGNNIEAQARTARYAALAVYPCLVLAQHADDQAETVLLQLLRGAGVAGLAAMPAVQEGATQVRLRPWLSVSRAEIARYAQAYDLPWVEDPSNQSLRFDRNFLRHQVLPLLRDRFPAWPHTVGRTAAHCAQAANLLTQLAHLDGLPPPDQPLALSQWRALPTSRQGNVLCAFLRQYADYLPHQAQIVTLQQQLQQADEQTHVSLQWGEWEVQQFADYLYCFARLPALCDVSQVWQGESQLSWCGGQLTARWARGKGVAVARLEAFSSVVLRLRQGGERLQVEVNATSQRVKSLWQQAHIPPWVRARAPYVWADEKLLAVANLTTSVHYRAQAEQWGVSWHWEVAKSFGG